MLLKIRDELIFENMESINEKPQHLFGVVTIDEYDKNHNLISTETSHNEIVLPGSLFTIARMFNIKPESYNAFLHPTTIGNVNLEINQNQFNVNDLKIFGFMIGNGGTTASGVIANNYSVNTLVDANGNSSAIPFIGKDILTQDEWSTYTMKGTENGKNYFYAKKFDETPNIKVVSAAGDDITSIADAANSTSTVIPRAEIKMSITENDLTYNGNRNPNAAISQIGLLAGVPSSTPSAPYNGVQLVTSYNFKEKDFNTADVLEMTYRIYCL